MRRNSSVRGVATAVPEESAGSTKLAVLLAMAMFVLVVDTSLMNVSISAVVRDLGATASGVQSTIALEALVSAAFILIGSKIGDLIGRKRAYVIGLLGYALGALSMTLSQSLLPVIIFWAICGGIGAALLLPAMQSRIHGTFEGPMQRRAYALVGAAAAIAAAVGPLLGGFVTTYLSWRVGFLGEVVIIAIWDVGLFASKYFRLGITSQTLQQIALGGMMIALPIYLQMVLEYNAMEAGLSLAPLSLTMFAIALLAGKRAGRRSPSTIILVGFLLLSAGVAILIPLVPRADSGWDMALPLVVAGAGLGLLVSQLNNYTLSPIEEERVSEAAGVNSAGGSFGLSFGLAFAGAIMLMTLAFTFTREAEESKVLTSTHQEQVADKLEDGAEVLSNTELEKLLAGQPQNVQDEILRINTDARPPALQIALLVPLIAGLLGLLAAFRMTRLPDPEPSGSAETVLGG